MKPQTVRGFTLVEVLTVCALATLMAALALPSYQSHLTRARRSDAVAALTRLQAAQERLRAFQGLYSADFGALQLPATSSEGQYALDIQLDAPDGYRATATARAGGQQAHDDACAQLVLRVRSGFAEIGPTPGCWNR